MYDKARELAMELLNGNSESSWNIVHSHSQEGYHSSFIYDFLLKEAMYYIGSLWQENRITVADEHLATGICDFILTRYAHNKTMTHDALSPKAMFFCMEGESHYLGLKIVSSLFLEHGWNVRFLGPNLPLEYALYSAAKWKPDVIGISLSMSYHLPSLKEYVNRLENLEFNPTVMVGSRLSSNMNLRPYCSSKTQICTELDEIIEWLRNYKDQLIIS